MSGEKISQSGIEKIKIKSDGLRGTIKESVENQLTGAISEDDQALIKFHGMYQQDDRDRREERSEKKLERLYSFMIRLRLPGGAITSKQWIALHDIAGKNTTGTIKITTRQTVQLHGLLKSRIKPTIKMFNEAQLDSIATCGDINRNVTCSSNPSESPIHAEVFKYAERISKHLMPKTNAYYEIWLDNEKIVDKTEEIDPLYEDRYLPRKFKIGIAIPPNNDVDVFSNDLGLIAVIKNDKLLGFNVAVGGGLSTTFGNTNTYARLATVLGFIGIDKDILKVIYEIITVQRDFGNRSDRKLARVKYTIDTLGVETFKNKVEERTGIAFEPEIQYEFKTRMDHFGWSQNKEGLWYYTLFVENGRVLDENNYLLKTALLKIAESGLTSFKFTANQNLIISDVKESDKSIIDDILFVYHIDTYNTKASLVRRNSIACVALPTCPLALAEGQRYLPSLITKLEPIINKYNLQDEEIIIRMTGCPNGCARSHLSEIGFIGTGPGRYNFHLGGDHQGERLNRLYKENMDEEQIITELDQIFHSFSIDRVDHESFGDFTFRKYFN
ncbi:MAG: assimilatory sulfite reductase (NADPH) hemoprotein subunit [Ginsengibacter sp.]